LTQEYPEPQAASESQGRSQIDPVCALEDAIVLVTVGIVTLGGVAVVVVLETVLRVDELVVPLVVAVVPVTWTVVVEDCVVGNMLVTVVAGVVPVVIEGGGVLAIAETQILSMLHM
jgi:hypothetical protein